MQQIIHALERAERDQLHLADELLRQRDYRAEIPAAEAERMREAISILSTMRNGGF